jgi:F-type H+-transporting ATPase subunit gamma
VGRKAERYFRFRGWTIDESFQGFLTARLRGRPRIAESSSPAFEAGEYDLVELAYTRFLSAASQRVSIRPLRAARPGDAREVQSEGDRATTSSSPSAGDPRPAAARYAEARLYAALLEGAASFFAAQQRAMKSATDNAEDLIVKYSRAMNRARQDAITTEIMEIVGGAEAMRAAQSGRDDLLVDHVLMSADVLVDSPTSSRRTRS